MKFSELIQKWEDGWRGKAEDCYGDIWDFTDVKLKKDVYSSYITSIDENWTIIEKPVGFITAIKALVDGKTIKCVFNENGRTTIYTRNRTRLVDQYDDPIAPEEILNGKWYIVE